jgi:hypothetical protein
MRFISRGAFLALLALVLSAVATSAASAALPEFQKEGKPLTEAVTFTARGGKSIMETTSGNTGGFTSSSFTGEIKGSDEITGVVITFTEAINGYPCTATGSSSTLVTSELKGTLGYLFSGSKLVGSLLEPVTQPFAACHYRAQKVEIKGSLLGQITPVNTLTKTFTISDTQSKGVQALRYFEGSEVLHELEANVGSPQGLGVQASFELTTSKAIEIKA